MLKRILEIARLYIYTTYRNRGMLIFGLLLPAIFTWVIGLAIGSYEGSDEPPTWTVAVVNQDRGVLGDRLVQRLDADTAIQAQEQSYKAASAAVEAQTAAAALVLPEDFSDRLLAGEQLGLEYTMNLAEPVAAQVIEQAVLAALSEVESWVVAGNSAVQIAEQVGLFENPAAPDRAEYFDAAIVKAQEQLADSPPVVVDARKGSRDGDSQIDFPSGTGQTSPGMMVIFTLFTSLAGGSSLLLERERGTLRRLMVMPMGKSTILAGKLVGVFLVAVIQILILITAGALLFDVDWGHSPWALLVMVLAFAFTSTCLGMLMAALVRTYAQLDALSMLIVLPLSGLGGAMWPIEIVPEFMQKLALTLPTGWAMRGFHDIVTRGLGVGDVLEEAGVLMAVGLLFLIVGVWRFRYE
jgi:ABC-2 type transport system permease protein